MAAGVSILVASAAIAPASAASSVIELDADFQASVGTGFDGSAGTLDIQPDGAIVVAGGFTTLGGLQAGKITRILADGTQDAAFAAAVGAGPNGQFGAVAIQADGKIVTAGQQQVWGSEALRYISRLNADGTRDTVFDANVVAANLAINVGQTTTLQPDGKILAGGGSSAVGNPGGFARLNADGTGDTAFNTALGTGARGGVSPTVYASGVLASGDVVVAGRFQLFNGVAAGNIVKLSSAGVRDTSFDSAIGSGFDGIVSDVVPLPDGSLLVGGSFTNVNGVSSPGLARLLPSGAVDSGFSAALGTGFDAAVNDLALTSAGDIIVSGGFSAVDGTPSPRLARINANGTPDTGFNALLGAGFDNQIGQSAVQSDGAIVAVGNFTNYNATQTGAIARLIPVTLTGTNPGSQMLSVNTAVNLPIQAQVNAATGTLTYTATGLPAGLAINPLTGVITGTPTSPGSNTVTVLVTHSSGATAEISFTVTVTQDAVITIEANDQRNVVGDTVNLPIVASDSSGATLTFVSQGLPDGLTLDSATGIIVGTASKAGIYSVTVTATNPSGESASVDFVWTVSSGATAPAQGPSTSSGQSASLANTGSNPGWNLLLGVSGILGLAAGSVLIARGRPTVYPRDRRA
ncbi:hypothetical protein GCM10022198_24460 [Klugiella xanthotipulae]|uniref:beta strand repeat-containing protein n=1 Tax=Klugiella xanthotipulae TaxID=244735 RepID=UPI0014774983|nr:putative Ig domain-containing protein [Klugiella xanthotipulae]